MNCVSRIFETTRSDGRENACHLSQPEARLLERLLREANQPVPRKTLTDFAWGGRPVAAGSLNHAIFNLRNAFGPEEGHKIILTVPNKGYCIRARLLEDPRQAKPAPEASAQPDHGGGRLRCRQVLLPLAVNLALVLALHAWLGRAPGNLPLLTYAPQGDPTTTRIFAERSLPGGERLAAALGMLAANPASFDPPRPFVYINSNGENGQYTYFLCDRSIALESALCGAYVIESKPAE